MCAQGSDGKEVMWGWKGAGHSDSTADIISRMGRKSSDTLPSCKLRQQQTVRNLDARLATSRQEKTNTKAARGM